MVRRRAQAADEPWQRTIAGQLSRLTDRSRLRRLRDTLYSKGARPQVTGIEDLCHAQVSHKWLYHLDACAGSFLTPHDYIANVQKRLGNRVWVGGGQCRCCGSFLDAESTREYYACVHGVVCGMKLGRPWRCCGNQGLTASQSRLLQWHEHGGQTLLPDSVGLLRCLDRAACIACGTIRPRRCRRCTLCGSDTLLRELRVGATFQDRRQPGHQDAAAGGTAGGQQLLRASSRYLQENLWTTARFRTALSETSF